MLAGLPLLGNEPILVAVNNVNVRAKFVGFHVQCSDLVLAITNSRPVTVLFEPRRIPYLVARLGMS